MRNLFNRHFDMLVRVLAFDQDVAKENSRIFGFVRFKVPSSRRHRRQQSRW